MTDIEWSLAGRASVLCDGQFGSTGKGLAAAWLAMHTRELVDVATTNAGANAGHTTVVAGRKFVCFTLPTTGVVCEGSVAYINAGSIIDIAQLEQEIAGSGIDRRRIIVHPRASVITAEMRADEARPDSSVARIASTMHGVGRAIADKVMRRAPLVQGSGDIKLRIMAMDLNDELLGQGSVVVEIPQGLDLSINHGHSYPYCVHGSTIVQTRDGPAQIRHIIPREDEVLCMTTSGEKVYRRVLNKWKKEDDRSWVVVRFPTSEYAPHDGAWYGARVTEDHEYMTLRGKVRAGDLTIGDEVYVSEYTIDGEGLQILLGSILGDGYMFRPKKSPGRGRWQETHGPTQFSYIRDKAAVLSRFLDIRLRESTAGARSFKPGSPYLRATTVASAEILRIAEKYGSLGVKHINVDAIFSDIDERGLAIWYCDDGQFKRAASGPEVFLHTQGFGRATSEVICDRLFDKFGVVATVVRLGAHHGIRLSRESHARWFEMIRPYVHDDCSHKLPDGVAGWCWAGDDPLHCSTLPVLSVESCPSPRASRVKYDIEVDECHNFFVHVAKSTWSLISNCTSRDCHVGAGLSDAGIHPSFLGPVCMVVRTYPIRVGDARNEQGELLGRSGPFYEDSIELQWERDFPSIEPERTTVTRRIRRIATWSDRQYARGLAMNRPTIVFLNFANYLPSATAFLGHLRRMRDRELENHLEPTHAYGFGPAVEDVTDDLDAAVAWFDKREVCW